MTDKTKPPVGEVFRAFPRALEALALVMAQGATKHGRNGWKQEQARVHLDALGRHLLAEARDGLFDNESGQLHAAHAAWRAMARLELMLEFLYTPAVSGDSEQTDAMDDGLMPNVD
jgi:hypothetical protein